MAHEAPSSVRDLEFKVTTPEALSGERWDEVRNLRRGYYDRTTGRSAMEVDAFLGQTTEASWNNPNKGDLRGRYARPHVVAAYAGDELVGYNYFADNGSNIGIPHTPFAMPLSGRAKLWIAHGGLVRARYHWEREVVDDRSGRPGLREGLTAVGLRGRHPEQAMSRWIFDEEDALAEESRRYGLEPDPATREARHAFGPDAPETHITMYRADSTADVLVNVHNQPVGVAGDTYDAVIFALKSAGVFDPRS